MQALARKKLAARPNSWLALGSTSRRRTYYASGRSRLAVAFPHHPLRLKGFRLVTRASTHEYVLLPSPRHPISLISLHYRWPELSREAFQARLLRQHAPLVLAQPTSHQYVRRYAQLLNIGPSQQLNPEGELIDAISMLAFASINEVEDFLVSDDYRALAAAEAAFADAAHPEY
ncbi:MAG: hypothetical protein EOO57_03905 [Hymenobacter sp.]|nr:MAG: hypothetical protein EOO57_03905 [Hymenobacter sp.]